MTVARTLSTIAEVGAAEWNALDLGASPFLRHEFLAALEATGCARPATGWTPRHLVLREAEGGRLIGAVPLYEKSHSRGEFVFDFAWAEAYARYGDRYYPKLVAATPFTPAGGRRLLVHPQADGPATRARLIAALQALAGELGASTIHAQFPDAGDAAAFEAAGWLARIDCQFHWTNRGYADFEDFLATFTAEKRKKAKRERRRVLEAGIRFEIRPGEDLDAPTWALVHALHAGTFHRHGHAPYLSLACFRTIAAALPGAIQVVLARHGADIVATAILFEGGDTLYGRYWGAIGDFHSLHFETCYHQGIEYAIHRGLARFEPGTQGEHKIARGFVPTVTHSCHFIVDPQYRAAIARYLAQERAGVQAYIDSASDHVPFRSAEAQALSLSVDRDAPDGP